MNDNDSPLVSIVITTRNRKAELSRALSSCSQLSGIPFEVLVYDDASTDGTAEEVETRFPWVRLVRSEEHAERVLLRNRAFREAKGQFVLTIDDDCYFTDPSTLETVIRTFEQHPQAGVVALPLIEPTRQRLPGWTGCSAKPGEELASFLGGAHAIRRSLALQVGGYREFLIHHQEERDFGLRILDAGWAIIYAATRPLVHTWSSNRQPDRIMLFGVRNTILVLFLNVPFPLVVPHLVASCWNSIAYKFSIRTLPWKAWGVVLGFAACIRHAQERRPVRQATYLSFRRLQKHDAIVEEGGLR